MTPAEKMRRKGDIWSLLRQILSQGRDIYLDHVDKPYEVESARLDAAARERTEQFEAMLDPTHAHEWVVGWPFDRCVCGDVRPSNVRPTAETEAKP